MHSIQLLSALVAAGVVSAQSCSKNIKVTEANPIITCKDGVVNADVIVSEGLGGALTLEGIKQIKGDLILKNVSITSLSSTSINAIGGKFQLDSLEFLDTLRMDSLTNVGEIEFVNLNRLNGLTFGSSGVTKIKKIKISDTFLDDLSGLNVATVEDFLINNNRRMVTFNSDLVNITGTQGLVLQGNGKNMELELPDLKSASELQFQDVKSIKVPSLKTVTQSLKLDGNEELTSFAAPKLATVGEAVSFIDNRKLNNVSLPQLTKMGGDLTIVNNTKMDAVSGFPKLEMVGGGIRMGGVFEEVELPSLTNVEGSANVTSTTDIKEFCEFFDKKKESGAIQGEAKCTSENDKALEGEDGGKENDGTSGSDSSGSGSDEDEPDAAGLLNVNMAVLGLAVVFGVAQLL